MNSALRILLSNFAPPEGQDLKKHCPMTRFTDGCRTEFKSNNRSSHLTERRYGLLQKRFFRTMRTEYRLYKEEELGLRKRPAGKRRGAPTGASATDRPQP